MTITKQCKLKYNPFALHLFCQQISDVINLQNKSYNQSQKLKLHAPNMHKNRLWQGNNVQASNFL